VPSVPFKTFIDECNRTIHYLIWLRWSDGYKASVYHYLSIYGFPVVEEEEVPLNQEREERAFKSIDQIQQYFSKLESKKCIALACPFRNIWFAEKERVYMSKYVHHTHYIQETAQAALKEMKVDPKNLIAFHWRFGEDSCALHPDPNMDFCWGTSIFCWAKLTDVLFIIESIMKETGILEDMEQKILYLAISTNFNPENTLVRLQDGLSRLNATIMRSTSLATLSSVKDNYFLSLIEQEICGLSKIFIASTWSTWSDYVVDWITANSKSQFVFSLDSLFKKYQKNYTEYNLMKLPVHG